VIGADFALNSLIDRLVEERQAMPGTGVPRHLLARFLHHKPRRGLAVISTVGAPLGTHA